jgi:hypothetical protein
MAVTKTILKKARQQAVVKFVGDGQANIDLNIDLVMSDETFLGYSNCNVTINSVIYTSSDAASNPILIKRPSTGANVLILSGTDNWMLSQNYGFTDSTNTQSNINIVLPPAGGTLILGVTKKNGYQEPNEQIAPN